MRKYFIYFKHCYLDSNDEFSTTTIELKSDEKANEETFNRKLNSAGCGNKTVLSWSLIEE